MVNADGLHPRRSTIDGRTRWEKQTADADVLGEPLDGVVSLPDVIKSFMAALIPASPHVTSDGIACALSTLIKTEAT